jgi:nitrite reductase (NADH) small subunit
MSEWRPVCTLEQLGQGKAAVLEAAAVRIAVFRCEDDRLFAVEDRCPHRGALLSNGVLHDGCFVACLDHGWSVCLEDGKVLPPEQGRVRTFPMKLEAGIVYVRTEDVPDDARG